MPLDSPRLPTVAFKSPYGPAIDEWALKNGFIKGTGKYATERDEPEANRSAAANELIRWALENHPGAEAIAKPEPPPKLNDRDREVLAYLAERDGHTAHIRLQSEAVNPDEGIVAVQTAGRLERLGLVELVGPKRGGSARLTDAGRALIEDQGAEA